MSAIGTTKSKSKGEELGELQARLKKNRFVTYALLSLTNLLLLLAIIKIDFQSTWWIFIVFALAASLGGFISLRTREKLESQIKEIEQK